MDHGIVLDALGIILALGAAMYLHEISRVLKGGMLERGVSILTVTPILIALSSSLELMSELERYMEQFMILLDSQPLLFCWWVLERS